MKIRVLSDLHFEFHKDNGKEFIDSLNNEADVCILAGDICYAHSMVETLNRFCEKYSNVIYLTGNHEYYTSSKKDVDKAILKAKNKNKNLSILQRESVVIDGQRFLGATLWFPYDTNAEKRSYWLNDFKEIHNFRTWIGNENHSDKEFIKRNITKNDIIVTHHLPTYKSVHPKYAGNPFNCFFVCDMEEIILENKPKLWVHGHTHCSMDYMLSKTRIVCNPFGYVAREENPRFNPSLILTV